MKKLLLGFLFVILLFSLVGCGTTVSQSSIDNVKTMTIEADKEIGYRVADTITKIESNSYGREIVLTEQSQMNLNKTQPPQKIDWSLEREQLNKRIQRWNDPNKISYIYLLSDYGNVIAYYPINGKVSSVNSKLTSTSQLVYLDDSYEDNVAGVVESPDMDGSYGSNGDAIFFFTTEDVYVEWSGKYILMDQPMKLTQEPLMTYQVK